MTATRTWTCEHCGKPIVPGEEFRIELGVFSHTACEIVQETAAGPVSDRHSVLAETIDEFVTATATENETTEQLDIFTGVIV